MDPLCVENALVEFDGLGGNVLLDGAIADCSSALESSPVLSDLGQTAKWRMLQATGLYLRFERDCQHSDLKTAKQIFNALITSPNLPSSLHTQAMYGLGRVYEAKYDYSLNAPNLEKSCKYYRQAMQLSFATVEFSHRVSDEISVHLGRLLLLLNLDVNNNERFLEIIELITSVLRREPTLALRAYACLYLSTTYRLRWAYGTRQSNDDLSTSEDLIRKALLFAPYHRHRFRFLNNLAGICIDWNTPDRIREGINIAKQAVALLPTMPPIRRIDYSILHLLGSGCGAIFFKEGSLVDLDSAIRYHGLLCSGSEHVHHGHLTSFCYYLSIRFEASGHFIDIDQAVEAGQRAVACFPDDRPIAGYVRLYIGYAHLLRFEVGGEVEDFNAARLHFETGITNSRTPALLPFYSRSLARLHELSFDVGADSAALDQAIANGREAVSLIQSRTIQASNAPSIVAEHGACLLKRYELHRNPQDLVDSVFTQNNALQMASAGYYDRHFILWRCGQAIRLNLEAHWDVRDCERCEELLQEAVKLATVGRLPKQSVYLAELAALYSARYVNRRLEMELDLSLAYYSKAAYAAEGLISDRFRAAVMGASLAQDHGRALQSTKLFSEAVSLLPRIAWLGLNASKRHAKLARTTSQLACDAAASAIRAGQLECAIELLEEGRSVVWRSVLELRADLRDLRCVEPGLADTLLETAQALEQDDMGAIQGTQIIQKNAEERSARRRRTAERWDELVAKVRTLKGFESFLKSLDFSVLKQAARDGPVVLLNVSRYGSHALIVCSNQPVRVIPLPGLDLGTVRRLAYLLTDALRNARDQLGCRQLEAVLLDISRQLWHGGMSAVTAALNGQKGERLRRVWWIPTGSLGLLPIHCAGPYKPGHLGIPDLYISSYSTTISALLTAQRKRSTSFDSPSRIRMLAIGVSQIPGLPPLPSTHSEMELIKKIPCFKDSCTVLYGPGATIDAVNKALPASSWLHACVHGHSECKRPFDSAFHLMDGPLTLSRISQNKLEDAEFAFLSACHSARHTVVGTDESIHLAAALQVAGFKGVVGTVWAMVDGDGPALAERFYHWLTLNGRRPDAKNVAEALHSAIKALRAVGVPMYRWAAFVHFGI